MKILIAVSLFVLLAGLAAVEYFHHSMDHHAHEPSTQTAPKAKAEEARELYRQHMRSHQ